MASPQLQFLLLTENQHNCCVNTSCINEVIPGVLRLCLEQGAQENGFEKTEIDAAIDQLKNCKELCGKSYKILDTTNLFKIIPLLTKIDSNSTEKHKSLYNSIQKVKNIRNEIVHDQNNAAYSVETVARISETVKDIVEKLGESFEIDPKQVTLFKTNFQKEITNIQDSKETYKNNINIKIKESVIDENKDRWIPMVSTMKFEELQFCAKKVELRDIFHAMNFEVMSKSPNEYPEGNGTIGCKTFACTDILSKENNTNIDIIEGDPGSGKTTYLRMLSLEFCTTQTSSTSSIFNSISSYKMMMLINCRDKENCGAFWPYFETQHEKTVQIFPEDSVISSLKEIKMIIAIDGLDEANKTSKALVNDVIQIFSKSENVRFLITTRPDFGKDIMEQLDVKKISYRVLKIRTLENINEHEMFIQRLNGVIPARNYGDLIDTFRTKHAELNSHFLQPLGLVLFFALFYRYPEKIDKLSHELNLLQLSYKIHLENMQNRMPDIIRNPSQCSRAISKLLGRKSLVMILCDTKEIDPKNLKILTDACAEIDNNIPVKSVISCVLMKQKCVQSQSSITAKHIFYNHSQKEYFASKVITEKLCLGYEKNILCKNIEDKELKIQNFDNYPSEILKILRELTGKSVEKHDLSRLVIP